LIGQLIATGGAQIGVTTGSDHDVLATGSLDQVGSISPGG
jgi:hypothetical protein